ARCPGRGRLVARRRDRQTRRALRHGDGFLYRSLRRIFVRDDHCQVELAGLGVRMAAGHGEEVAVLCDRGGGGGGTIAPIDRCVVEVVDGTARVGGVWLGATPVREGGDRLFAQASVAGRGEVERGGYYGRIGHGDLERRRG